MTFWFFILPLIINIALTTFYAKNVNKDRSYTFIVRGMRWFLLLASLIPGVSWIITIFWIYVYINSDTTFKENKITNFFMDN